MIIAPERHIFPAMMYGNTANIEAMPNLVACCPLAECDRPLLNVRYMIVDKPKRHSANMIYTMYVIYV